MRSIKCRDWRPLNGHENACLKDRKYMKIFAEILTGYKLNDAQVEKMTSRIIKQG